MSAEGQRNGDDREMLIAEHFDALVRQRPDWTKVWVKPLLRTAVSRGRRFTITKDLMDLFGMARTAMTERMIERSLKAETPQAALTAGRPAPWPKNRALLHRS